MNHEAARQYCLGINGHLVEINSQDENDLVNAIQNTYGMLN